MSVNVHLKRKYFRINVISYFKRKQASRFAERLFPVLFYCLFFAIRKPKRDERGRNSMR